MRCAEAWKRSAAGQRNDKPHQPRRVAAKPNVQRRKNRVNVTDGAEVHEVLKQAFPCTFGWTFGRCIHIGGLCPKHVETRRGHQKVYPASACSISALLRWCWN